MSLLTFFKSNKYTLVFFIIIITTVNLIIFISSHLTNALNDLLYLDFLIAIFFMIYFLFSYINWCSRYKFLKDALEDNTNIDSVVPEDKSFYSALLRDIIATKNLESDLRIQDLKKSIEELNDYITKWVHEIKMPVSVCELILESYEDPALVNSIQPQLEKIKFLTNQVLYISRATNYYEDLSIRTFKLDTVVKASIKRNSTLLISKNIEINISNLDFEILSDEKWISYVLDQLLNNSYKYMHNDGILKIGASLDYNNNVMLRIRDNGIGILPKDISRIFDQSFTGNNKSYNSKSTGMGLYITKKMLDKLGHKIEVISQPNVFTEFALTFYKISDQFLLHVDSNTSNITKL